MNLGTGAIRAVIEPWFLRGCRTTLVALLLLCLCVNSWAECFTPRNTWGDCLQQCPSNCISPPFRDWCNSNNNGSYLCNYDDCNPNQLLGCSDNITFNTGSHIGTFSCVIVGVEESSGMSSMNVLGGCGANNPTTICCGTQAEADSVACELNPDAEGCANACTPYKNDCESRGGEWQGQPTSDSTCTSTCNLCNTEEAKFIEDYVYKSCCAGGMSPVYSCGYEGIPLGNTMVFGEVLQATCNSANWETNKICEDYLSSSSAQAESSASGESSSSEISEYCQLFPTDLVCKCQINPDSPDCVYLSSSSGGEGSSGSGEGSSGSGEGSSGSGGDIGGGDSSGSGGGIGGGGDWEYDYRDSLHRIINATARTANNTGEIANNTGIIRAILQQAKCLFVDCTDYGAIKDALDSNVNIPSGDTAGVLDLMARLNNLDSLGNYINGLNWASYGDSIDGALNELGNGVDGLFTDSGLYGPMNDYRDLIEDKFPTAQWSYTSSCPTALNSTISFNFPAPIGTISAGRSLGGYFCGPLPPFNITLGNMIRAVIRLALTIAMAIGIFKAATGFKNE